MESNNFLFSGRRLVVMELESYRAFAGVYDVLMQNVDYAGWVSYILSIWERYGVSPGLVLDLGCGTGTVSILLSKLGYDVIGSDGSADMLAVAAEKAESQSLDILFLNQEMQETELYGTVDCIISVFDSINYIVDEDELRATFALLYNYLNEGGLLVFDVNTPYKYEHILADNVFAENFKECSYIWENYFESETQINEYELNLFIKRNEQMYERFTEFHYQRSYEIKTLKKMLENAGFGVLDIFDAYSFESPSGDSDRVFFVAKKPNAAE